MNSNVNAKNENSSNSSPLKRVAPTTAKTSSAKERVNFDQLSHSSISHHDELVGLLQSTIARTKTFSRLGQKKIQKEKNSFVDVKECEIHDIVSALDAIEAHYIGQLSELSMRRAAQLERIAALCEQVDAAHENLDGKTKRMRAFYDEYMRD